MRRIIITLIAGLSLGLAVWAPAASANCGSTPPLACYQQPVAGPVVNGATFTTATTDPNWSQGQISGSVTASPYLQGAVALVVLQSTLDTCTSDEWSTVYPNEERLWSAGVAPGGTVTFDLPNTKLLPGVYGQRLCAIVVGQDYFYDQLCISQSEVLFDSGISEPASGWCDLTSHVISTVAATQILSVVQPPVVVTAPAPPSPTPIVAPAPPAPTPVVVKCAVPKLKGLTLTKTRTALTRAHCSLGHMTKPKKVKRHHILRVASQSLRPGTIRSQGSRISVKLV